ncbi:SH3 domain-containing protein [Laspinema olomoucense]|uniref:SH3 domain-containing protein n=1 Tax=Laspinema olomoucense D3b TaxID=2953688 RepID=A0ABT2NB13_9CYAN|nr:MULTISPECIES: SH3 domain-containing protein [unclassified Laspinema]MCT7979898.1 SH3 domain-containing protein [Laspinema sp. D3b]MCT7990232.1 SH3 domain-containing protein [Laspinema sp. D3a]MCT7994483.1 SH3 domain-containing protein [Laspinema sp. D3c]
MSKSDHMAKKATKRGRYSLKKLRWSILMAIGVGLALGALLAALIRAHSKAGEPRMITFGASGPVAPPNSEGQLILEDEAEPGSDFYEFRAQLREAVQKRNAEFLGSILPETGITIGFSRPQTRENLNLDDPKGRFWLILEKAVAIGCAPAENPPPDNTDPGSEIWVCPNVAQAFARQVPPPASSEGVSWQLERVVVVGENVNARSQPSLDSEAIATLSNEVVQLDRDRQLPETFDPIDSWTAIRLSDDREGYVYNRYVYSPLESHALFGKINGEWQLLGMPGGD